MRWFSFSKSDKKKKDDSWTSIIWFLLSLFVFAVTAPVTAHFL